MLTCLHKFYPLDQLIDFFTANPARRSTFYTLGIRDEDFDKLKAFVEKTADVPGLICIDAANGYTKFFVDRVRHVRELCPRAAIMAGNVATPEMVQELLIEAEKLKSGPLPARGVAARRRRKIWRSKKNCLPTPRNAPNMSCSWTSRATTSGASAISAACR